ncbi:hypothetical protein COCNU_06G010160 [Cocos nucifera]|uniref:Uncharacterized protein n=1 Tax=Cocos nucifera TaxID=13894 RepID=A0A8K0IC82_COCNU|nr:hypothetical protein COCNU_06G010160 [Cocos nucifera]
MLRLETNGRERERERERVRGRGLRNRTHLAGMLTACHRMASWEDTDRRVIWERERQEARASSHLTAPELVVGTKRERTHLVKTSSSSDVDGRPLGSCQGIEAGEGRTTADGEGR